MQFYVSMQRKQALINEGSEMESDCLQRNSSESSKERRISQRNAYLGHFLIMQMCSLEIHNHVLIRELRLASRSTIKKWIGKFYKNFSI